MLTDKKIKVFAPTQKPGEGKVFYEDILGLEVLSQDNYALEFNANGTLLRIITVQVFKPYPFTILGWNVDDIVSVIKRLNDKTFFANIMNFLNRTVLVGPLRTVQKWLGLKILMEMYFH